MTGNLKWPIVRLSTLAAERKGAIVGGPFGSDLVSRDYVSSGVPVIRGVNLPKDAKFSCEDFVYVSENKADALHLNCASPGDLVFTQRGTLGQVGLIPKKSPYRRFLISQSQMKMTVDKAKADPLYLYYYFRLPSTVSYIENHALQSGVPHINLGILRKFEVIYPPLLVQQKIVAILSAYDDLIENNQRRIALLEKMAEEIHREWFVRMRFPGHKQVKFEKGVPDGWLLKPFSELVEINPTERPNKDEEKPYVGMEDLSTSSMYFVYKEKRTGNSGSKFRSRDTLFPRITPCLENGKRGFVMTLGESELAIGSTEFIVMREKILTAEYIYLLCCLEPFRKHAEISMVGASGRQRVSEECFSSFLVKTPPVRILDLFSKIVKPIFEEVALLSKKNSRLTAMREQLLPRLISAKLAVEHLDIHFPPSMRETGHDQ
jgi:type I restriction enzyme S subunit